MRRPRWAGPAPTAQRRLPSGYVEPSRDLGRDLRLIRLSVGRGPPRMATARVRATADRRAFAYVCGSYHRKGPAVCDNRRVLAMSETNAEVLRTIEATCLSPAAVERIVEGALL